MTKVGSLQPLPDPFHERKYEPDAAFDKTPQLRDIKTERYLDSYMSQRQSPSQSLQPNTIPDSSNSMAIVSSPNVMKGYCSNIVSTATNIAHSIDEDDFRGERGDEDFENEPRKSRRSRTTFTTFQCVQTMLAVLFCEKFMFKDRNFETIFCFKMVVPKGLSRSAISMISSAASRLESFQAGSTGDGHHCEGWALPPG